MEFVRTLARACRTVPLVLLFTASTAAAQVALSANGQQLNNFIGRGVALADFNGDGALDAFVVNQVTWQSHDGRVYLGDGRGQFADSAQRLDEELRHSHGLALGDFDGDRDLDVIVVAQGTPPGGHVYLNDGKGRFTSGPRIGTSSIENVALADFDGDGDLDVFLACIGPDEVWLNDGRGSFSDSGLRLGTGWSWQLAVGDLNGDRLPDVFVVGFTNDRTLPRDQSLVAHPADVWLNTSRRAPAPAVQSSPAGPTTIHDAATRGDLQAVKAAVAADPTVADAEKPPNKKTALHYAAQNGHADVVAFLLDRGADVNRPNIAGETPLHYAAGPPEPAVVSLLLARGASPTAMTANGATPLRMATAFSRLGSMQALFDKGADVRDTLPNGQTLLHMAARVGPPESVALLVSRGADVNAAAKNGQTPLLIACIAGNDTIAAALLDRKADPNVRDAAGWTPVEAAVRVGHPEILKRLLQAGARPTGAATADKRTALHHAAARGWLDITNMLLAAGADRSARDSRGRTPLDLAVRYGNRRVADALRGTAAPAAASPPARPVALERAPKIGEAVVWYLGHMGFAVRTANHFLVFDYDGRGVPPDEPSLANGSIDPDQIKAHSTTVFITHSHTDHYAPAVFDWKKTVKDITYVAGFEPEGKEGYVAMAPRETKTLGGLDITTTMANDEGVGFFVKVDGVTIFHSGDHSAGNGAPGSFGLEIDFLAGRGLRADLLFMPISVTGDQEMNQGVHYAMKQLSAIAMFPGHVAAREDVFVEFARDAATAGITTPIRCPEYGGDHFTVSGRWRG